MNKLEKQAQLILLDGEKQALRKLTKIYTVALKDIKVEVMKLKAREQTQSVQYQLQNRLQVIREVEGIINLLQDESIATVSDFLNATYENAHISENWLLNRQDVPIVIPLNQAQVLASITRPIESWTFAQRVGRDMASFKYKVGLEITRGSIEGLDYVQIAKNISRLAEESLNSAYRIARTEGGRVQSEAKYDLAQRAKAKGAEIVKQWDSTLDSLTRPTHQGLDQQIRELEEPFESPSGAKGQYPRGFGVAEEDINCRCCMLQRARWGLDDELRERMDNEARELIEVKDYADYKARFLDKAENIAQAQENVLNSKAIGYNGSEPVTTAHPKEVIKTKEDAIHSKGWQLEAIAKISLRLQDARTLDVKGEPNSVVENYKKGILYQRRYYGNTGKARMDIDYSDHSSPKAHPFTPHMHYWVVDESNHDKVQRAFPEELTPEILEVNKDGIGKKWEARFEND